MNPAQPPRLEARRLCKRFGGFDALAEVSLDLRPGRVHALLGENGAGKSTLVKCIMGYYQPDSGDIAVGGRPVRVTSPKRAQELGVGMVYQHFTLVENMTALENLVLARARLPAFIDWKSERAHVAAFLERMPFGVPLDRPVRTLAAGEKQRLEILKQLYLGSRVIILDEPTSVLTPRQADDILGTLRDMAQRGELSIALITHKFREVTAFADDVTVLRRGRVTGTGPKADYSVRDLAELMVGSAPPAVSVSRRTAAPSPPVLEITGLAAEDDLGLTVLELASLRVHSGEIVGVAGVSGNGQEELVEVLAGQRAPSAGELRVGGSPYAPTRRQICERRVRLLPEAPLRNACVPAMSVGQNIAFRCYDVAPWVCGRWFLRKPALRQRATRAIGEYRIKTPSADTPIATLSGGNVQRAVLARELEDRVALLIAANPCFGLDVAAVSEIRSRMIAARDAGTAVLLVSADLDEIFALSDRIVVMSEGRIVHEVSAEAADISEIGAFMAGARGSLAPAQDLREAE